jgi:hypothetical protein
MTVRDHVNQKLKIKSANKQTFFTTPSQVTENIKLGEKGFK